MKQTTIPVKPDVKVQVRCNDNLSVEGNDNNALVVIVEQGESLRMTEDLGTYRIVSDTDCRILLPVGGSISVEKTGDDCILRNLMGKIVIGKVGNDLVMDTISGVSVESVGSDCRIRNSSGGIVLARVGDTLQADGIQDILANSVGDSAYLKNVNGKVDLNAGDDISIHFSNAKIPEVRATAGSDIECYLPADAGCQLKLISKGEDIRVHAAGQDVEIEQAELELPIGDGGSQVLLTAGSSIRVSDQEQPDWHVDFSDWFEHWKDFGFEIARRVREEIKGSMDEAWKQADKARWKASKEMERAFHDLEERGFYPGRRGKMVGFSVGEEQPATTTTKSGPTDEERMLILKMLQEKKISVEEAEKLLNALER